LIYNSMENKPAFKKIIRKECLEKYPNFPTSSSYKEFYPKAISSFVLAIASKSDKGNIKNLALEFTKFMKLSGIKELVFLVIIPQHGYSDKINITATSQLKMHLNIF